MARGNFAWQQIDIDSPKSFHFYLKNEKIQVSAKNFEKHTQTILNN